MLLFCSAAVLQGAGFVTAGRDPATPSYYGLNEVREATGPSIPLLQAVPGLMNRRVQSGAVSRPGDDSRIERGEGQIVPRAGHTAEREEPPGVTEWLPYPALVLISLLLLALIFIIWPRSLRRRVALKTAELRAGANRVLRAIRDINQLIIRERDPERLINKACELLVRHRGYASALIVLTDENGRPATWAGAGPLQGRSQLEEKLNNGVLPSCCETMPPDLDVRFVENENKDPICLDCAVTEPSSSSSTCLCARLALGRDAPGYLVAALGQEFDVHEEEKELFSEVAEDLAYALRNIRIDSQRRDSERERESLSQQLVQAQKMEAVGRLAGGVAHDFNNLLMGIQGYTELCLELTEKNDPRYKSLEEIIAGVRRSADLTRQLLTFASKQSVSPVVLNINDAISEMLSLLRRLVGENIRLVWRPGSGMWAVKIDPSQVDQILANLSVNARDAIEGTGELTVVTENVVVDKDFISSHPDAAVGKFVMISISDNGCGMTPDILEHIFEPFFTTKAKNKGTGLGLPTIYGIVRQNKGFITVKSSPMQGRGRGTTFRIYLPRCDETLTKQDRVDEEKIIPGGDETILLAEDEKAVLDVVDKSLSALGYHLLIAATPARALSLADEHTGEIDLLIADLVMPEMSGQALAGKLLERYPHMKCLFFSGYIEDTILDLESVGIKEIHFVQKPVSMQALSVKVREILG